MRIIFFSAGIEKDNTGYYNRSAAAFSAADRMKKQKGIENHGTADHKRYNYRRYS